MAKIYFTITGTKYCYGTDIFKKGMKVGLVKQPDNAYDTEAIKVCVDALGKVGYVANSPHTVLGECRSAGRIYDHVTKNSYGEVIYVFPHGVICELKSRKKHK